MKYEEVFKVEERTLDNFKQIHLYSEGNWWRAYEWSAYLCSIFPSTLDKNSRLIATRKITNLNEDGIVFVGLQLKSFEKYLPSVYEKNLITEIDSKHMMIDVSSLITNIDFNEYISMLKEWKQGIELKKKDKSALIEKQQLPSINSNNPEKSKELSDVIKSIIQYPIANKTLLETANFVSKIQSDLLKLNFN